MVELSYSEIVQKSIVLSGEQYEISVLLPSRSILAHRRELLSALTSMEHKDYKFYKVKYFG